MLGKMHGVGNGGGGQRRELGGEVDVGEVACLLGGKVSGFSGAVVQQYAVRKWDGLEHCAVLCCVGCRLWCRE